jgi:hypothetical protein
MTRLLFFKTRYCVAARLGIEKSGEKEKRRSRGEREERNGALVAWLSRGQARGFLYVESRVMYKLWF